MRRMRVTTAAAAMLFLSACAGNLGNLQNIGRESDPARFYALSVPAVEEEAVLASGILVGVGPVSVADYLDRSHIVIRTTATELELGEFDRWAGKLDKEIQRAVMDGLSARLDGGRIIAHPWRSAVSPAVSVEIAIDRFERDVDGKAKLSARWQIYGADGRAVLSFRRSVLEQESGAGYEALVAALSHLVGALSGEIAAELVKNSGK